MHQLRRTLIVALLLTITLDLACNTLAPAPMIVTATDSGISGTITSGPTCPGPIQNPPIPGCEDKPLSATILIRDPATDTELASFTTGADGSFLVGIAPGTYVLDPQPVQGTAAPATRQTITVTQGVFTTVFIQYDTGLR